MPYVLNGREFALTYSDHRRLKTDPATPGSEHYPPSASSAFPNVVLESAGARQERLREKAGQILALRRKRSQRFSSAMFSEFAWEMLLILYARGAATVAELALQSGSPTTTAGRWIDYLERQELVQRLARPTDDRGQFVSLTHNGKAALDDYLSGVTELSR